MRAALLTGLAAAGASAAAAARPPSADVHQQMQAVLSRLERVESENQRLRDRIEKLEHVDPRRPVEQAKLDAAQPAQTRSAFDMHLDAARPRAGATTAPRVFGHAAVNTWSGESNAALRAGRNGTTNVWDSALGVAARLGDDTALRMRAFTVLPAIGGEGDGFGGGRDYAYLRDLYIVTGRLFGSELVNLRLGRVPYAFGEEYLQFDAPANPLVSHSAAFMWGFDEGAQVFGDLGSGLSYTASLNLDGETGNGSDDFSSKARGLKIAGDSGAWHWSASHFDAGRALFSEFWIGALPITPVGLFTGTGAPGGASTSGSVRSHWSEGDVRWTFDRGQISAAVGSGRVDDRDDLKDRRFTWYKIEPIWQFRPRWYAAGRYSELRVDGRSLGYAIRTFENDGSDLGYDVHAVQRLSLGLGFRAGDRLTYKLEHTIDELQLIPTPLPRALSAGDRNYTVLQAAAEF